MRKNLNMHQVEEYCKNHTSNPPVLLNNLEVATKNETSCPQMMCGKLEGRFLKLLTQLVQPKYILEIGTFTGYSALSMAEGLPADGKLITLDVDPNSVEFANKFFNKSANNHIIESKLGNALDLIPELDYKFDMVFIDADKKPYPDYFKAVLPKLNQGGLIIVDNTLSDGRVLNPSDTERGRLMDEFNQMVLNTKEVEVVMLPIRDGITLARKK